MQTGGGGQTTQYTLTIYSCKQQFEHVKLEHAMQYMLCSTCYMHSMVSKGVVLIISNEIDYSKTTTQWPV